MEYPHLQEIYSRLGGEGFTIVSVETTNRPELAREFVAKVGATFPVLLDTEKVAKGMFGFPGVPYNLVINREGKAIFRHLGFSEGEEKVLEAEIRLLLGEESA